MSATRGRTNRAPGPQNRGRRPTGVGRFDKSNAALYRVSVASPGTFDVPGFTRRCWLEWEPRADATGPDRRLFYSRVDETGAEKILGERGTKLPRNGKSLLPMGRQFLTFSSGTLKVWMENEKVSKRAGNGEMLALPSTVNSERLRSDVLMTIAGTALPVSARGSSGDQTPSRRR